MKLFLGALALVLLLVIVEAALLKRAEAANDAIRVEIAAWRAKKPAPVPAPQDGVRNASTVAIADSNASSAATAETDAVSQPLVGSRLSATLVELTRRGIIDPPVIIGTDGKLRDAFAAFFDISPAELREIKEEVANVRSKLGEMAAAAASVEMAPGGKVKITVPPLAEGAKLEEKFSATLAIILGLDRAALVQEFGHYQFRQMLGDFGADSVTLLFGWITDAKGDPVIMVNDVRLTMTNMATTRESDSKQGVRRYSMFRANTAEELIERYGPIGKMAVERMAKKP
ncbi:MAG: hypothetical protein HZA31_14060 [Opitutae bacterium]|nr:hypothetical protein [Opitutae bacterium]